MKQYHIAAGPPESKPRKIKTLVAALFLYLSVSWTSSYTHVPDIVYRVHHDETCGEVFDKVPSAMELLRKISVVGVDAWF